MKTRSEPYCRPSVKVCAKCGTLQQWALWPQCACGGEFIDAPPAEPMRDDGQLTAWEKKELKGKRDLARKLYVHAPFESLLFLAAALILSAIYQPSLHSAFIYTSSAAGLGLLAARIGVSRHWSVSGYMINPGCLFLFILLRGIANPGTTFQSVAILFWMLLALKAPFCIWRKEALAKHSADPVTDCLKQI